MPTARQRNVDLEAIRSEDRRKRVLKSFHPAQVKRLVSNKKSPAQSRKTTSIKLEPGRWERAKLVAVALGKELSEIVAEGLNLVEEKHRVELMKVLQPIQKETRKD